MDKLFQFKMKSKKGISSIIATLLLIVLTAVLVVVVWTVVNNLVKDKIGQSSACFGNFDEVTLNDLYSCYNSSANNIRFSLNIGNLEVDSVIVTISSPSQSKGFTLTNELETITNLANLNGAQLVQLPNKNSGITYVYNWEDSDIPNSVQIAPIIDGQQCSISDSITTIDNCILI